MPEVILNLPNRRTVIAQLGDTNPVNVLVNRLVVEGVPVSGGPAGVFVTGLTINGTNLVVSFSNGTTTEVALPTVDAPPPDPDPEPTITVPGAPTDLSAAVSGKNATLVWTAPANNGGAPVTDYVIRVNGVVVQDGISANTQFTLTNLSDGSYSWSVAAVNEKGPSPQAAASSQFIIDTYVPPDPDPDPGTGGREWTVEDASYTGNKQVSMGADLRTIEFNHDGTRLYAVNRDSKDIYQWNLPVAYDLLSLPASHAGIYNYSAWILTGQQAESAGHGFYIRKSDGAKAWLFNRREIWELNLSTPWDITTATTGKYRYLSPDVLRGHDIDFTADGTTLYIDDRDRGAIHQYAMSTPWDIDTLTYLWRYTLPRIEEVRGVQLNPTGTRMFCNHTASKTEREYRLSTPWDVRSAVPYADFVISEDANPRGMLFVPDGTRFIVAGSTTRRGYVYTVPEHTPGDPPPDPPPPSMTISATTTGVVVMNPEPPVDLPFVTITSDGIIYED